jgi:glutathione S-transferase
MRVYGSLRSGNCLKVKYTADYLGIPYEWIPIDGGKGETRTPDFLRRNPAGQMPVVEFDDGRCLAQSNAIIRYLARGSALIPADPFDQAKVDEWLFWEQNTHEPSVAVCRFQMFFAGKPREERDPRLVKAAEASLDLMERTLADREWFVGGAFGIADIALVAYTRLAHEGGFDLADRPRLRAWIARCERTLGLEAAQAA